MTLYGTFLSLLLPNRMALLTKNDFRPTVTQRVDWIRMDSHLSHPVIRVAKRNVVYFTVHQSWAWNVAHLWSFGNIARDPHKTTCRTKQQQPSASTSHSSIEHGLVSLVQPVRAKAFRSPPEHRKKLWRTFSLKTTRLAHAHLVKIATWIFI